MSSTEPQVHPPPRPSFVRIHPPILSSSYRAYSSVSSSSEGTSSSYCSSSPLPPHFPLPVRPLLAFFSSLSSPLHHHFSLPFSPFSVVPAKKNLPVFFWIHGGSNIFGSNSEYGNLEQFALKKEAIVVAVNFRLGLFGFLSLEELNAVFLPLFLLPCPLSFLSLLLPRSFRPLCLLFVFLCFHPDLITL